MDHRKDRSLNELAEVGNVAQFVSFSPQPDGSLCQEYACVRSYDRNHRFDGLSAAVEALLANASDGTVNVRSYEPTNPRSREFVYGIREVAEVVAAARRLSGEGLHIIINETVDIADGGVSGVYQDGVIEFAPDDTPRCVEKPGVASLPVHLGERLLQIVYGFLPEFGGITGRVEFSIHPKPRGFRGTHTLLWEQEDVPEQPGEATLAWPNRFSRHIGDKLYGLLMAELAGARVPYTNAITRRVAPFAFGGRTSSSERWIRTCPVEQEPGLFTTHKGWLDPFALMAAEDPDGDRIASVLSQHAVPAVASGASLVTADGTIVVEGLRGEGDLFMLGKRAKETLPVEIVNAVRKAHEALQETFGHVRTEWVHDGQKPWIVQLHKGATSSTARELVPGEREKWVSFDVTRGLEELRTLLGTIDDRSGITLRGDVGLTSHIADLVRKSGVPTRIEPIDA